MKRLLKWSLFLIVIGGVGWFAHALWRGHASARAYAAVVRGDSESRVLQFFGSPHHVAGPPQNIAWDSEDSIRTNGGECVREFWYAPPLTLIGEAWTIGFDAHSNAVSKYHYLSP